MLSKRSLSWSDLNKTVAIGITGIHVLALFAVLHLVFASIPWYFTWSGFWIFLFLSWLSGWIGIDLCYHRLLTHWSFKTPTWFLYLLTGIATLNLQGGPISWVGIHRIHHQHSDKEGDPHSPKIDGFTWAHMFWVFFRHADGVDPKLVTLDLQKRKGIMILDRFSWVPPISLAFLLFGVGFWCGGFYTAMSWVIWGVGVRTVLVYHITWFVNSAAHTWGYQNFNTKDGSRNSWWVALLSGGEGWHNNHHAQPRSAAHGMRWFEFDQTYWTIRVLGLLGLAKEIVKPNLEQLKQARISKPVERIR